jgi:hypothetical protein
MALLWRGHGVFASSPNQDSGIRVGFFYPFAEPAKHFLTIKAFATVKAVKDWLETNGTDGRSFCLPGLRIIGKARDRGDGRDERACGPGLLESRASRGAVLNRQCGQPERLPVPPILSGVFILFTRG